MLIRETRTHLASMLVDAGVNLSVVTAAEVRTTVEVFARFAALRVDEAVPFEDDGDGVLAQFGTYGFRGRREFSADLTRQFIEAGDEDAPMWQLSCTFHWVPSAQTEALSSGDLWSFGMSLDAFFAKALALPGWNWALTSKRAPRHLTITLGQL